MRNIDNKRGLSINPDKVEFSREPSVELDPMETFSPYGLTPRESELFPWLARGKTNAEIGLILGISPKTVTKHLENIYIKLGAHSRTAAVVWFLETMYQARKSQNAWLILKSVKISEGGSVVAPSTDIAQKGAIDETRSPTKETHDDDLQSLAWPGVVTTG